MSGPLVLQVHPAAIRAARMRQNGIDARFKRLEALRHAKRLALFLQSPPRRGGAVMKRATALKHARFKRLEALRHAKRLALFLQSPPRRPAAEARS